MVTVKLSKVIDTSDDSADDQLNYTIPNFESFTIDVRTPISPMPLPEETAEQNILVKIEGNTKAVTLTWTIVQSAVDLAGGGKKDGNTTIKSVPEQIAYLSDAMQGSSLQHRFRLTIFYSEVAGEEDLNFYGFINNIQFNQTGSTPVTFTATMNFLVGNVITTLDGDVPFEPTSIVLTNPGGASGRITVTWSDPVYKGGAGSIVDYDLELINTTSFIIEHKKYGQGSSPYTTPTGAVRADTRFAGRVRANSNDGDGKWSDWRPVFDEDGTTPDGVKSSS